MALTVRRASAESVTLWTLDIDSTFRISISAEKLQRKTWLEIDASIWS